MKELFLSECRRFRKLALVATAVHLVILLLASRLMEPLQQNWQAQAVFLATYCLAGLGLAAYQFGTHRQPSRWLWLMHRPLSRARIFAALSLASTTLLVFAIGLPALLAVAGTDAFTGRTVDARHYLIPAYLLLMALTAWLAGCYLMLCGRRGAFAVLFVPGLLAWHFASSAALLVPAVLSVAMMAALAYTAFKPDRGAAPATPGGLLAAGIPLMLGCYFVLLWGGSIAFQSGLMLLGVSPNNRPVPPAGGYTELVRSDGRANLQRALAASGDPRAAHWRRQVALLDVGKIQPEARRHAVRGQMANSGNPQWFSGPDNVIWTFNHDRMLYEGRDGHTDAPRGWFGQGGPKDLAPFGSVPVIGKGVLLTRNELVRVIPATGRAHTLFSVRAPEALATGPEEIARQPFVLTNQRLVAFRRPADPAAALEELYSVPLPGPFGDLQGVDVARLLDGTLLSFDFGQRMIDGEAGSRQHLLFVDAAGKIQPVGSRAIEHDFPLLFEHKAWWLSPLCHALLSLPERLLDTGRIEDAPGTPAQARPQAVLAAALAAALLSCALAAWRLRGQPRRRRLAWCAACLVAGPPCAAALWVLAPAVRSVSAAKPLPLPAAA